MEAKNTVSAHRQSFGAIPLYNGTISMPFLPLPALNWQTPRNPFTEGATIHYALDRNFDLLNVLVTTQIDYDQRGISGSTENTLAPLREGVKTIMLMASPALQLSDVTVDGHHATYRRDGDHLFIDVPGAKKGVSMKVRAAYTAANQKGGTFGAGGGFHWIEPQKNIAADAMLPWGVPNSSRTGFWTQGETEFNHEWMVTWDYPNDLATSETITTAPTDWTIVGNGVLRSTKGNAGGKTKTWDWKMDLPHATYLIALVGGPLDVKKDSWRGKQLWYVVPKGLGYLIDDSFGDTKDMLTFYSDRLGFQYPWPKYAQNAMWDFGGGMENVSSTTLGAGSLTEAREGFRRMSSLNSHELGHQWFGDTVTCKDWGDAWLNETFATYMQMMYFEHSQGANAYAWEVENAMQSYFREARRYKRPISTKLYKNGDAMFDSHTYPKGGVVLHTLRRKLGDENFYGALQYYLNKWQHTPVESAQLRRAFTEATGINAEPFWAQWFEAPGHPVLEYTWAANDNGSTITVKQTQDNSDGTPVYDLPTKVMIFDGNGQTATFDVHITKTEETFNVGGFKPVAMLLDPEHDFLRELKWPDYDVPALRAILSSAPNAVDKQKAMDLLLKKSQDPADLQLAMSRAAEMNVKFPAIRSLQSIADMKSEVTRSFFLAQLNHPDLDRRAQAARALGNLPRDPATEAELRNRINDKEGIGTVVASINALAAWDKTGNKAIFEKALTIKDKVGRIKKAAEDALK
ncbi:hypothetical protein BH11ARM2_BH11ARM2_34190 [soil metagenome]